MINISGVYTDGASRYNFQSLAATSYSMFGVGSAFRASALPACLTRCSVPTASSS